MPDATTPLRVAIVEDHVLYRDLLESTLSQVPGLRVDVCVAGSAEAKKAIQQGSIDVALLDVELADGNGIGLGVSLRRANPDLGIVLLSGRDMIELVLGLSENERHGWSYLSKTSSTSLDVLVDVIRKSAQGIT